jgi:hypothetical protein
MYCHLVALFVNKVFIHNVKCEVSRYQLPFRLRPDFFDTRCKCHNSVFCYRFFVSLNYFHCILYVPYNKCCTLRACSSIVFY